eukprot:CAMPEP_0117540124 /NCGR_PEP_ID=MMETSP0784-20121206/43339_1 /TAXON_ID=39447 /ORGANISM="" /LENGTH=379 /DNA_ID=CAMNT_0005336773 /DNA_START=80 /DNA_END=1216 /DNA_ORIENTATION=+
MHRSRSVASRQDCRRTELLEPHTGDNSAGQGSEGVRHGGSVDVDHVVSDGGSAHEPAEAKIPTVLPELQPAPKLAEVPAAKAAVTPEGTPMGKELHAAKPIEPVLEENVGCMTFRTESACINHKDGRVLTTFGGFKIRGEICVWCCGKPCQTGGTNLCEPRDWLMNTEDWLGEGRSALDDTCEPVEDWRTNALNEPVAEGSLLDLRDLEHDERTGLDVPRFWQPEPGLDVDDYVHTLNGQPSIMLMIASYRDFQCPETLTSALERAEHPSRITVAVVDQRREGDLPCEQPPRPCTEDAEQAMCRHASRIKVFTMNARIAEGPIYARHVGHRMYRGEAYILQVDAHVTFVNRWDTSLIRQWASARNEYAVLSTYLTDVQG